MSTYYNGYKGHVSDAGVNDSEQHVYEITNVQNQTNAQILSTAQLHAALDPHPLHGLQLLSEAHGTETVAVVPDNPNGTGTAKLTAIVAGTPQSHCALCEQDSRKEKVEYLRANIFAMRQSSDCRGTWRVQCRGTWRVQCRDTCTGMQF